ncbi:hypothetical protein Ciccas_003743 [Cichlidogyrus casuarinus]|uniref:Uncharacterized protein n=1 Tax=Cichlidogyrus casuarinus TaxID=1844966 RepID=A0ABD2QDH5_9PLAT
MEVLFDPRSHPTFETKKPSSFAPRDSQDFFKSKPEITSNLAIDELEIQRELTNLDATKEGKWLRFQRNRPAKPSHNGPSEFHQIPFYELADPPQLDEPATIAMRPQLDEQMVSDYATMLRC